MFQTVFADDSADIILTNIRAMSGHDKSSRFVERKSMYLKYEVVLRHPSAPLRAGAQDDLPFFIFNDALQPLSGQDTYPSSLNFYLLPFNFYQSTLCSPLGW